MRALAFAALLLSSLAYGSQKPLQTTSTTLVDLLSADPDYTQLLRLLQRTRLIPTLNKLNGSTLFAPTNDAVQRHSVWTRFLAEDGEIQANDNINEQVRQTLLYHLLNYTLPTFPPAQNEVATYNTLHFPRIPVSPPSPNPPPAPPWVPLPGGSLHNESQRLRAAVRGDGDALDGSTKAYVDVDASGQNGTPVVKDPVSGTNCLLVGINDVLEVPKSLAAIIKDTPELSYLVNVLPEAQMQSLEKDPGLTVFLPEDDAWGVLHPVIRLYLESPFARGDLKWIVGMHVADGKLGYSDRFGDATRIRTIEGNKLRVNASSPDGITVSGAALRQKDVFASNGVLHTQLKDGTLLETELIEIGLAGGRQVLDVGVSSKAHKAPPTRKDIYFGGAGVIGDPIHINKTLIYLISRPLTPPTDVLTSALPSLSLSTYLAAVFSTSLAETLKNLPRTTFLIPKNSAWERLGLVSAYLLMNNAAARKDLESVVLHHTLDSIRYLEALKNGTERTFRTIEGTDVTIERRTRDEDDNEDENIGKDGIEVVITGSGGWDGLHSKLALSSSENDVKPINTLTQTGVMHVIDTLLLPRSVDITLGKLVRAAGGGTMASLVVRAGMEWVLNGTAPPEDSEWSKRFGRGTGWTLLVPRDEAWKRVNLTALWDDKDAVRSLVSQHLVPSVPPKPGKGGKGNKGGKGKNFDSKRMNPADANSMPLDMYAAAGEGASHITARSAFSSYGQISFHDKGDHFIVGIADARGTSAEEDWARVISWGRSTSTGTGASTQTDAVVTFGADHEDKWMWTADGTRRGGVIKIDRVLVPYTPKWWVRWGPPVAGGLAGLTVLLAIGFTGRWLYKRRESEPTYEPVGRDEEEDG
ncbi:hypothetical protein M408DRAFT_76434 [Serendipita vermifera MAFF 305830]|uniref:FAS1 domain-containing protein n=1 Tax=Serendipita vermifera MAFF 305830 TaxID=933852 RepID=A0A0C2WC49_SERVB|nr:hypothetical protein M408DRAFT_76434 [Serendipita vermifera MAFF 305830]